MAMLKTKLLAVAATIAIGLSACGGTTGINHHGESQSYSQQSAGGTQHPPGWAAPSPRSEQVSPRNTSLALATMYDSTELSTVPTNPFALAGYTAGYWPTYFGMRRNWPTAHTISIAISTHYNADCLDVEPGDAAPWQVPGWVRAEKGPEFPRPCVYSSYWEYVNEIRPILARNGIGRGSIFEWSASYTYSPHLDAGFDATQWTDKAFGRNLDASLVTLPFLSIAQPPYNPSPPPPPPPAPETEQQEQAKIALLRKYAHRDGCYTRRGSQQHKCKVWARQVRHLEAV